MKILFIVNSLVVGGAETSAVNYMIELKKSGEDVVLLEVMNKHTELNKRLEKSGIRVLTATPEESLHFFRKLLMAQRFSYYVHKEKPDVIHVYSGLEKMRFARISSGKVIFRVASDWERCKANGPSFFHTLDRMIREGMHMQALSHREEKRILADYPDAKVHVIPNGVNIEEIRAKKYSREDFFSQWGIPLDAFVVGHVGRFHAVKNHSKVFSVFGKVIKCNPNAFLILVGDGSESERAVIQTQIEMLPGSQHVKLLGLRSDAISIISLLDALLLPSFSEGCPNVLLEAQALGVRCVSSEGIPEDICCNDNCIRLPLEADDRVWAETILGDQKQENGKNIEDFDIQNKIDEYLQMYSEMIQESAR